MIEPDPNCSICNGEGVATFEGGMYPCSCRGEPNNCDRCATLQCGEARAPSSRWKGSVCGHLCDECRMALGLPYLHIYGPTTEHEPAVIMGNYFGLLELQRMVQVALSNPVYIGGRVLYTLDNEGFNLVVIRGDDMSGDNIGPSLPLPYTKAPGLPAPNVYAIPGVVAACSDRSIHPMVPTKDELVDNLYFAKVGEGWVGVPPPKSET